MHYASYKKDVNAYKLSIGFFQKIVKAYVEKNNVEIMQAAVELSRIENNNNTIIKYFCAAYDLLKGWDYTKEETK
jgi:hypothetical protein